MQVDRVNTTATVWLGSTVACAQCHNHKYDPFSQKDYFKLLAFFANPSFKVEKHGAGSKYVEAQVDLATPEQDAARSALRAQLEATEAAMTVNARSRRRAGALGIRRPGGGAGVDGAGAPKGRGDEWRAVDGA